jgi:beta-aspartyl-peptidase (threonine type)
MTSATAQASTAAATAGQRWSLAIHGGAGVINSTHTDWLDDAKRGLEASLRAGQAVLESGGSAIDAVVAAVVSMENDPHFNAGRYAADLQEPGQRSGREFGACSRVFLRTQQLAYTALVRFG